MEDDDVRQIVQRLSAIKPGRLAELSDTDDLFANGLRSFDTVQIMLALEERFDIEFPDAMLTRQNFATLAAIRTNVETLLADMRGA